MAPALYHLRSLVVENLNLKLFSLAFAFVMYALIHGSQDAQRSFQLSVVALTPPDTANRVLVTPIPPQIHVQLRGPRSVLDDLHPDDMANVQLDLHAGNETRITFDPSMIPVPPGLKVDQITPPTIDLAWEDVIVRDVPVEVGVLGTPATGYVVKEAPRADPRVVRARGPKSEVLVFQRARVDAFEVGGLTEGTYTRQLALDHPPGRITFDVSSVSATVEVSREVVERPFTRVPVAVVGRSKAKVQPSEVDVRLACPPQVEESLRPEQVVPRVQVTSTAEHGSDALPVQLAIEQCEVHVIPPTVVVRW
ncbi:MAG TPA: CdaR family protein [Polyangiaceae bacterium]|jgi:YbbR domain-containing protein